MADWKQEWAGQVDERTRRTVERAEANLGDLAGRYVALEDFLTPGGAGDTSGSRRPAPGSAAPVRLDVVDLSADIERWARKAASLVAGALRAGVPVGSSTVGALTYIRRNLGPAALEDPTLADDVDSAAGKLRWRCQRLAGEVSAAFPVDVDCPACGLTSLWVHPGRGIVKCGVEDCGEEWTVDDYSLLTWSARRA